MAAATLTLDLLHPDAPAGRLPLSERMLRERAPRSVAEAVAPRSREHLSLVGDDDRGHEPASEQGGGLTLDDLVVGVWEGLSARRTVACPACGEEAMAPRFGSGPAPVGGRCASCRTTIA